jgi:hypothetical protein
MGLASVGAKTWWPVHYQRAKLAADEIAEVSVAPAAATCPRHGKIK